MVVHLLVGGLLGGGRRLPVPGLRGRLSVTRLGRGLTVPGLRGRLAVTRLRGGLSVPGLRGGLSVPRLGRGLTVARLLTVRVVGVTHTCSFLIDPVVM
ncbi:hypothetical protein Acsp04_39790 [Actinomadura sp. NBRC 104425]|nr:hypothetical protein Acsp04_39790 [Actinomadura sp. NBRC 104425]